MMIHTHGLIPILALVGTLILTPVLAATPEVPSSGNSSGIKNGILYQTGFEKDTKVVPFDPSSPTSDDDVADDEGVVSGSPITGIKFYYEGGDAGMRNARIIKEPGNLSNHIVKFWIGQANAKGNIKARIQADTKGIKTGLKSFHQSVRFYLPEDMKLLKSYPSEIGWLTIMEIWNNSPLKPFPFRVTVGLHKSEKGDGELHFHADAQDIDQSNLKKPKFITIWSNLNKNFEVPFGKWMTLEYFLAEGDGSTGRFFMAATPDGGKRMVLFDITNHTHHTANPSPAGFVSWNPIKLYTSKKLADYMQTNGKALEAWWDDLTIWNQDSI